MTDPTRDTLQKTLMFESHLRVSLPEAAQHEAVSVLGMLIAAVMGETSWVESEEGSDE